MILTTLTKQPACQENVDGRFDTLSVDRAENPPFSY
jgi:hypothetical protein